MKNELEIDSVLLYVHRNHEAYRRRGAHDGHLDFHTAPQLCTTPVEVLLYVRSDHKDY